MKLPVNRNTTPSNIAEDIVSVQPMTEDLGNMLNLNILPKKRCDKFGDCVHCFVDGWMVFDGKKFISICKFVERYPDFELRRTFKNTLDK